ncbi:ammonium transporter [Nocardia puris]|uniref:ammonium transporter n=1 Tax=Nocardia puris TaxID=208602 RepID=UPI0018937C25|nr:ammonium transporter [Nocardia puris]MBF6211683.1 ammonium transporter [Nocardia puris]MBF6365687.1 ammonium transporter [Nocardia puris]MBF6460671.1 ammonium transporter [Nocardia puris]
MIFRRITAAVVPLVVAVAVGASTANAQPVAAPVPDIGYEAKLVGDTIVTTLTHGTFALAGNSVDIKDTTGRTVLTLPLSLRQDGLEYPMPHTVRDDGRVLELTAVKNVAAARPAAVLPVASNTENQRAMEAFLTQFSIATAIGSFIGLIVGGAIGLIGVIGGPLAIGTIPIAAGIGAIVGTIIAGGPTLIVAGIDLINTLNAPPGTTKWAGE